MKSIFAKAFAEAAILLTSHTLAAKTFAAFWSRVSPKLAEGVGYFEKHDSAGLEADKTFLERITFRDPEITRIVDGCLKEFSSPTSRKSKTVSVRAKNKLTHGNWRVSLPLPRRFRP